MTISEILKEEIEKFPEYCEPHEACEACREVHCVYCDFDWKSTFTSLTKRIIESDLERLEGTKKIKLNGEGLPFENSPEIYGNHRVEAYRKGYNQALTDIISHLQEQLKLINEN